MQAGPPDLAQLRLTNALRLFEEFVRATARHADATTLRGLERRFAERVQIQPSYWSQIKSRSRHIGERLARQFEQQCHKPRGWMDAPHDSTAADAARRGAGPSALAGGTPDDDGAPDDGPRDDDERFIVALVLSYYRRHPQRARTRLLDLLGEVLTPPAEGSAARGTPATSRATQATAGPPSQDADAHSLWRRVQAGAAPLKKKR